MFKSVKPLPSGSGFFVVKYGEKFESSFGNLKEDIINLRAAERSGNS